MITSTKIVKIKDVPIMGVKHLIHLVEITAHTIIVLKIDRDWRLVYMNRIGDGGSEGYPVTFGPGI